MGANARFRLSEYASKLIKHKAKQLVGRFGFTRSDRADIEQDLILHLLQQMRHFDPKRGSENTFVSRIVNRKVVSIIRHHCAEQRSVRRVDWSLNEPAQDEDGNPIERGQTLGTNADRRDGRAAEPPQDLMLDLRRALETLDVELRRAWDALLTGSVADAARQLGISRFVVYARAAKIREHFAAAGLDIYLDGNPDSSSSDGVCDK